MQRRFDEHSMHAMVPVVAFRLASWCLHEFMRSWSHPLPIYM